MDNSHNYLTGSYQHCLSEIKALLANMEKSLERYSEKDKASDFYLDQENDKMQTIADYVNIAEELLDFQIDNFIHKSEHAREIATIHARYERLFEADTWERMEAYWTRANAGEIDNPIVHKIKALRA